MACGCGIFIGTRYADQKSNTKTNSKDNETTKKLSDAELNNLIKPFIQVLSTENGTCSSPGAFYINKNTTYNNMDDQIKFEIAYVISDSEFDEFPVSEIEKAYKYAFGKDKNVNLPKYLDIESKYANYLLQDDKYVLTANGGGCAWYSPRLYTKIIDTKYNKELLTVKIGFALAVREAGEPVTDVSEDEIVSTIYNNHDKKRVIESNVPYLEEESIINKLIETDKTDYINFTFKYEDDHYIFEKAELVER